MLPLEKIAQIINELPGKCIPGQSVDCVIVGFRDEKLYVLLSHVLNSKKWMVPSSFVNKDESLDDAAQRVLLERTKSNEGFIKQYHCFGGGDRKWKLRPMSSRVSEISELLSDETKAWLEERFITTAYYVMVDIREAIPQADYFSDVCAWHPLKKLPKLVGDHDLVIKEAFVTIKREFNHLPLCDFLLPDLFTLSEMHRLIECIFDRRLDRANFQRKVLRVGLIERRDQLKTGQAHRSPYLYSFNKEVYEKMKNEGVSLF